MEALLHILNNYDLAYVFCMHILSYATLQHLCQVNKAFHEKCSPFLYKRTVVCIKGQETHHVFVEPGNQSSEKWVFRPHWRMQTVLGPRFAVEAFEREQRCLQRLLCKCDTVQLYTFHLLGGAPTWFLENTVIREVRVPRLPRFLIQQNNNWVERKTDDYEVFPRNLKSLVITGEVMSWNYIIPKGCVVQQISEREGIN